jgi:CrcB protein
MTYLLAHGLARSSPHAGGSRIRSDDAGVGAPMSAQDPQLTRPYIARGRLTLLTHLAAAAAALAWKGFVALAGLAKSSIALVDTRTLALYGWIALGSALGGVARFWFSGVAARLAGETFPWGTIAINVVGSFVIGFFATLTGPDGRWFASSTARQFVMVGICGGFTTFSSFSLQTLNLAKDGEWVQAAGNIGGSVVLCLAAVCAGYAFAASLDIPR